MKKTRVYGIAAALLTTCIITASLGFAFAETKQTPVGANAGESSEVAQRESDYVYGADAHRPSVDEAIVEPDIPSEIAEKEWYEYIEYSEEWKNIEITSFKDVFDVFMGTMAGIFALQYCVPLNYDESCIMTVKPLSMTTKGHSGDILLQGQEIVSAGEFTTASSVTVSYSISQGYSLGFSEKFKLSGITSELELGSTQTMNTSYDQSISRTFSKAEGITSPWRVVQYTVQVPLRMRIIRLNGMIENGYYLCNLMFGTCRQWADGYIEHWQTGKRIAYEGFFDGFYTAEKLLAAAKNKKPYQTVKG